MTIGEEVRRRRSWDAAYTDPVRGDLWTVWSAWKDAFREYPARALPGRAAPRISVDSLGLDLGTAALVAAVVRRRDMDAVLDALSEAAARHVTLQPLSRILLATWPEVWTPDDCGGIPAWRLPARALADPDWFAEDRLVWCDGLHHYVRQPRPGYSEALGPCPEAERLRVEILALGEAPKPPARAMTFDSFEPGPAVRDAFDAARAFIGGGHRTLILLGLPGRGKTHLATAIGKAAGVLDMEAISYGAGQLGALALRLREWGETGKDAAEAVDCAVKAQVLILDDLPKAKQCESLAMDLLSRRQGWLVVTGQPQEYAALPDAVRSRIEEGAQTVEIKGGEDYRRRR